MVAQQPEPQSAETVRKIAEHALSATRSSPSAVDEAGTARRRATYGALLSPFPNLSAHNDVGLFSVCRRGQARAAQREHLSRLSSAARVALSS